MSNAFFENALGFFSGEANITRVRKPRAPRENVRMVAPRKIQCRPLPRHCLAAVSRCWRRARRSARDPPTEAPQRKREARGPSRRVLVMLAGRVGGTTLRSWVESEGPCNALGPSRRALETLAGRVKATLKIHSLLPQESFPGSAAHQWICGRLLRCRWFLEAPLLKGSCC